MVAVVVAAGPLACGRGREEPALDKNFLERHWRRPIPPQGKPPEGWPPVTTSLAPADCAVCHRAQFEQWRTSAHAAAYSPGLHGQLLPWIGSDDANVAACQECHAPLTEQLPRLRQENRWVENPALDRELRDAGLVCAVCHVRDWRRYGPPRRDGSTDPASPGTPHEGALFSVAFESSEFCGACHQFEEPAANGKPLQNTVAEWRDSPSAARGETCQTCHMPDRAHLWRGIHDPETTRRAAALVWEVRGDPGSPDFRVRLGLRNVGAGHHLPTYVTPKIRLDLRFLDSDGGALAERSRRIGRVARFDGSEWIEDEDTRIAPGAEEILEWSEAAPPGSATVVGTVVVFPDDFYEGFFEDLIAGTPPEARQLGSLREALRRTQQSSYVLYDVREDLAELAARTVHTRSIDRTQMPPAQPVPDAEDEPPQSSSASPGAAGPGLGQARGWPGGPGSPRG